MVSRCKSRRSTVRSFRVRQLAAAFLRVSVLAKFCDPVPWRSGRANRSRTAASKLAGEKAAASCRTLKLRVAGLGFGQMKTRSRRRTSNQHRSLRFLVSRCKSRRRTVRSFRVRQLAAAFLRASLLAKFCDPVPWRSGRANRSRTAASKLAGEKAAASCRTLKLRSAGFRFGPRKSRGRESQGAALRMLGTRRVRFGVR